MPTGELLRQPAFTYALILGTSLGESFSPPPQSKGVLGNAPTPVMTLMPWNCLVRLIPLPSLAVS